MTTRYSSDDIKAMREELPYGWTTRRDTQVLFNREYQVMLERDLDGTNVRAGSGFAHAQNATFFFNDGNPPWDILGSAAEARRSRTRCEKAMFRFASGKPLDGLDYAKES